MNVFLQLTREFNAGSVRAIVCSGQAVVLHRLALASKDGDWIVREEAGALGRILDVLAAKGARYRFGAPLDVRWLAGGWSSHLEFHSAEGLRVRTDFFTRPPRLSPEELEGIWQAAQCSELPFVAAKPLARMKMTMREKDYPIIGELARRLENVDDQMLFSRSPRDLIALCSAHPEVAARLSVDRPLLALAPEGEDAVAVALDAERRRLMREDENRLAAYRNASRRWEARWPEIERRTYILPLSDAHQSLCDLAAADLPFVP